VIRACRKALGAKNGRVGRSRFGDLDPGQAPGPPDWTKDRRKSEVPILSPRPRRRSRRGTERQRLGGCRVSDVESQFPTEDGLQNERRDAQEEEQEDGHGAMACV